MLALADGVVPVPSIPVGLVPLVATVELVIIVIDVVLEGRVVATATGVVLVVVVIIIDEEVAGVGTTAPAASVRGPSQSLITTSPVSAC